MDFLMFIPQRKAVWKQLSKTIEEDTLNLAGNSAVISQTIF